MGYKLKDKYNSVDELETRDRAISVLYGRTSDDVGGDIVPIRVDAQGNLIIGTQLNLETDNLDIGDVVVKGTIDVAQTSEQRFGLAVVGAGPSVGLAGQYSLLTQEPRYNFTGGALDINVASSSGGDSLYVTEAYVTADANANARPTNGDLNVSGFVNKTVVLSNSGANDARVTVRGSVDNGVNYDITLTNDVLLAAGNTIVLDESRAMTRIEIQARSASAGNSTTVNTRAYAVGT